MSGEAEWRAEEYVALGGRKRWRVHISDDLIISSLDEPTARLIAASREMQGALNAVKECCLFADDDHEIGVSEDPHIPSTVFDQICAALAKSRVKP